jgi:ubiquinone/menaquinone biosynthesis C-methylase UbiE
MQGSPNSESIALWNDVLAPRFLRFRRILVDGLGGHGKAALERHGPATGAIVLDVGCGFGETTIELASRVAPRGYVLGIDCCASFVTVARQDAARAKLTNLRFEVADAQVHRFRGGFDLCFSRFGTLFFQDPVAALGNLRRALRPGGRLVMVVWRWSEDNAWASVSSEAARAHLPAPRGNTPNDGPGPFSMASQDVVGEILRAAGFVNTAFERVDCPMLVGPTVDEATEFLLEIGPAVDIIRDAGPEGDAKREVIATDLRRALTRYQTDAGVVMSSSSWTVAAQAGAG